ncbi:MAG: SRPBCC domain-containing protein [Ignavibacteriales bacterium]|nr:SRPBCC domain-containing protein [Ignavibacteriales bacterium]
MKPNYFVFLLFITPVFLFGQEIRNTSYITSTGERVLRIESILPAEKQEVWKIFTTAEGWQKWAAPIASVDFKVGGLILTNYDRTKTVNDSGTIQLPIINYIEGEMITLKVILTESFTEKVRKEDMNLQEIIQLVDLGSGKTKVISSMIGWGTGPDWDKTYDFFERGNKWSYEQLIKIFR